jgi:hypothetical protein
MNTSFEYRFYVVSHDGSAFCADPCDGEPFQLRSRNMMRVTRAIDMLWNAVEEKVPAPDWVFASDVIDLDAASVTMLVIDRDSVPAFPSVPMVGLQAVAAA